MERIPFGEAMLIVTKHADNSAKLSISMSDLTFDDCIADIAKKRGLGAIGMIAEALRLERLLCESHNDPEKGLYIVPVGEHRPRRIIRA